MNDNEQLPTKFEFPVPRMVGMAVMAGFVSLTGVYLLTRPTFSAMDSGWAKLAVYAPIPLLVTFTVLCRSDWHRQNSGAVRLVSLFLASSLILAAILAAVAVAVIIAGFFSLAACQGVAGR
jgi:hypothetical protein